MAETLIKILKPSVANQIAAGEVVERPASVAKELCENSLDAKAKNIVVEIQRGGIKSLKVTDDGQGMQKEDLILAFEPHATSKLRELEDLLSIHTKGFRGEALASISSVAQIVAKTRFFQEDRGHCLFLEGGEIFDLKNQAMPYGTSIEVKNLFFNVPARYKFLKKDQTEGDKVRELVLRLALSHPEVSFTFIQDGKMIFKSPGTGQLGDAIYALLGKKIYEELIPLKYEEKYFKAEYPNFKIEGFIGQSQYAKRSKNSQFFFVNRRLIKSAILSSALEEAYKHRLMKGLYPSCVILIECPGEKVDVNVHPQKLEVRFAEPNEIYRLVYKCIDDTLHLKDNPPREIPKTRAEHERLSFSSSKELMEGEYTSLQKHKDLYQKKQLSLNSTTLVNLFKTNISLNEKDDGFLTAKNNFSTEYLKEEEETYKFTTDLSLSEITLSLDSPTPREVSCFTTNESKTNESLANEREEKLIKEFNRENIIYSAEISIYRRLSSLKYRGTVFDTFIILEDKDLLYLIDQHAAHEKILFEQLYAEFLTNKPLPSQLLLTPYEWQLSKEELQLIQNKKEFLNILGFKLDFFSENSFLVREIPELHGEINIKTLLDKTLVFLEEEHKPNLKVEDEYAYDYLAEVACKQAIKANDKLSGEEVSTLLIDLEKLKNPQHCPHGRPIIIEITREELNRRFKRIVS